MSARPESPLEFPCTFAIKAFGRTSEDFGLRVMEIVRRHASDTGENAVRTRPSRKGKYTSVTITIRATSKAQLDSIYQELSQCKEVLMTL